ncbi:hypothetical protein [Engelhardtia mirabilis]|uniref:hypothetical protein n=1 Tax=Engelhardtia mirabilis TaxID=2528011 RepID=UPI00119E319F
MWVLEAEGGARIECHVPAHAWSKDSIRHEALGRSLALYRIVFGQPRQDGRLAFAAKRVPAAVLAELVEELRVDLAPRGAGRRAAGGRGG